MSVDSEATDCPSCGHTMTRDEAARFYKETTEPSIRRDYVNAGLKCTRCTWEW